MPSIPEELLAADRNAAVARNNLTKTVAQGAQQWEDTYAQAIATRNAIATLVPGAPAIIPLRKKYRRTK